MRQYTIKVSGSDEELLERALAKVRADAAAKGMKVGAYIVRAILESKP